MKKSVMPRSLPLFLSFLLATTFISSLRLYGQDSYKLPDAYTFKLGITYAISSDQSSGNKMIMWYSENGYSGMAPLDNQTMFMVVDLTSMKMITLIEAQKMAMIIDMKKAGQKIAEETTTDAKAANATVTKTGNTQTIAGYSCDEYKITSDKSESYVWLTTALGAGYGDYAKNLMALINGGRGKPANTNIPDLKDATNGVMLKLESTDLSTKKKTTILATDVNATEKIISTSGFKTMSMPGQ